VVSAFNRSGVFRFRLRALPLRIGFLELGGLGLGIAQAAMDLGGGIGARLARRLRF
jgi:hypothetical protein